MNSHGVWDAAPNSTREPGRLCRPHAAGSMTLKGLPVMADFRKLVISTLLADGQIDDKECSALRKELWADGKIDKKEVAFLIDLRNEAQKKAKALKTDVNPTFTKLFFKAIEDNVLDNGIISTNEAKWLRTMLFADGKIDADEKKFLAKIKKAATKTSLAFEALYEECMAK